jgi:hypothetical protein
MNSAAALTSAAFAGALVCALTACERSLEKEGGSNAAAAHEARPDVLYGRITAVVGGTYEGRLRWGGDQEAFWGDYFNGFKDENPWAADVPPERLKERRPVEIFGVRFGQREHQIALGRPFMARFGDIARIEGSLRGVRVTLKSGTPFDLDRNAANDLDDGVRVWDPKRGAVTLDSRLISTIELLPATRSGALTSSRLHGTVRTRHGEFTGFIQWNRKECLGTDELNGFTADRETALRFDTIRSIARRSRESSLVTLVDGRELELSGTREVGKGHNGLYVDDVRYGRVLVSWDVFERVDFSAGADGPAYDDFPPGRPLTGIVVTGAGRRITGRLVYDLDESETTETLDAPSQGVDYTIPFDLITTIGLQSGQERGASHARVTLRNGQTLALDRAGDLGSGNLGILVYADGAQHPEFIPWTDIDSIQLDPPPVKSPPR